VSHSPAAAAPAARALEADLAEVQLGLGEVGEGRVVAIDALDRRVGEEDRAAAVGLQAVLVGVDDDRVALRDRRVGSRLDERLLAPGQQREEAAVGAVDVQAHAVALAQGERLVDAIDGAEAGRAGGEHDGPDVALRALGLDGVEVETAAGVGRDRRARDAQQLAHARMGVVRGRAVHDALAGMHLARHPQASRLAIVRSRSDGRDRGGEAEHDAQLVDHLDLEAARPWAAVERVVVGVDEHRRQVAGNGDRMRRLEHLPGIAGMEEGVVVGHPLAEGLPRGGQPLRVGLAGGVRV
jgi:hypothetical protein